MRRRKNLSDAVKRWLEYLPDGNIYQRQLTNQLLACIRLPLLLPEVIVDNIDPICVNREKNLIVEGLKCHLFPERSCLFTSENTRPRIGYFHLMGFYNQASCVQIAEFNRETSTWSDWFSTSKPESEFGVTAMNGHIIFSGGRKCSYFPLCNSVTSYDCSTRQSKSLPSMTSDRYDQLMIAHDSSLYIIGGKNSNHEYVATVEKFNSESESWISCESLHTPRASAGVAVIDNKLYVVGGSDRSGSLRSVECFSTETGKWKEISPMNMLRSELGVVAGKGLLYVFGGFGDGNIFERYDPSTDKWTVCYSGDNRFNYKVSCAAIGNSIYVSSDDSIREYDVIHNTCKPLPYPTVPGGVFVNLLAVPFSNPKRRTTN